MQYRRLYIPGAYYFFTVVTLERRLILANEIGRKCLKHAFKVVNDKYPFETTAICVLPDHLHSIWRLPENDWNFSKRWQAIKSIFSREYKKSVDYIEAPNKVRGAGIWQDRFWEHAIRDEVDFWRHVDYIHFNPIKHSYVKRVSDWEFSSYHRYVKLGLYEERQLVDNSDIFECYGFKLE